MTGIPENDTPLRKTHPLLLYHRLDCSESKYSNPCL